MSLAATVLLWPAEALAQRGGRGGHSGGGQSTSRGGGGGGGRVSRPVVVSRGGGYRPVYYRSYYRPYYYSSFYWGGAFGWYPGWYPYSAFGYYPYYGYGYYDRPWYDDLGSLRIEVKPREAQVYVDGYFAGLVDDFDGFSQRLRAKPGEHQIEVYLPGFQPIREKMLFRPGSSLRLKSELQPLAAGEPQPPKPEPIAPPPTPPAASNDPGGYDPGPGRPMTRRRPGYRPAPPDAVGVDPAPAAPPEESGTQTRGGYGTLSIRVQPRDAVVLVDGEKWDGSGVGQRLMIELAEGTHRIEIQKNGFTTYSTEVRVRSGQVTTINVSLTSAREI